MNFKSSEFVTKNIKIEFFKNAKMNFLNLYIYENCYLNNYIFPNLRYKNIQSSFLIQPNQYVDPYTILGYLEAVTENSLEIVKFKIKNKDIKQILLISNKDCFTLKKISFQRKD